MYRPLDSESPRHMVAVRPAEPIPGHPLKDHHRKPPAPGAGRMADNGGSTLRLPGAGPTAKRHLAPPKQLVSAQYFLKAGSPHDPDGNTLAKKLTMVEQIDALTEPPPSPVVHARHTAADELKALRDISPLYAKDPRILSNNDSAADIMVAVVTRANAPLMEKAEDLASPQVQSNAAIQLLNRAIKNLDPGLAAEVVTLALPTYEKFYRDHEGQLPDNALFGFVATGALVDLTNHIAGTRRGNGAVERLAAIGGFHTGAIFHALAAGAPPAYAVEFVRQLQAGGIDPSLALRTINDGMVQFRRDVVAEVKADVDALTAHNDELTWLMQNDGPALSTQQLDEAFADYVDGEVWKKRDEELCQHLSAKGVKLIHYMTALGQIPPDAGCADLIRQTINTILGDPATSLAISKAYENDPTLTSGKELKGIAGLLALDTFRKSGDLARKFTGELASTILRKKVIEKLEDLDLFDPGSVRRAKEALASLSREMSFGDGSLGYGFGPSSVAKVVTAINKTIDEMAASTSNINNPAILQAAQTASLRKLNDELLNDPSIVKAFANDTLAGLVFRGFVLGVAGLNLTNNVRKLIDKPGVQNAVQTFVASADLAQKGSAFLLGLRKVNKASWIGRFGGEWKLWGRATAGDVISMITSMIKGFDGVSSLVGLWGTEQDTGDAIFSFAEAASGGLISAQAYGFAAWTGWVGVGATTAVMVGREIYKDAKAAHKYEEASKNFLLAAGYITKGDNQHAIAETDRYSRASSPFHALLSLAEDARRKNKRRVAAAEALSRRGDYPSPGAGLGQMPFLAEYAKFKNMTPDRLRDWICSLPPDQVRNLSDVVLMTLHNGLRLDDPDLHLPRRVQVGRVERVEYYKPDKAQIIGDFDKMLENRNVRHPPSPGAPTP